MNAHCIERHFAKIGARAKVNSEPRRRGGVVDIKGVQSGHKARTSAGLQPSKNRARSLGANTDHAVWVCWNSIAVLETAGRGSIPRHGTFSVSPAFASAGMS